MSAVAYAHSLYEPLDPGIFQVKWDWDPTLLFFLVLGVLYVRGLRRFRGPAPIRPWQKFCFFTGLAILTLALLPPIDPLADRMFCMHMVQHMLVTSVGVPLMLFGVPFFVFIRGLSPGVRRRVYFPLVRAPLVRMALRVLSHPLAALCLYEVMFWFWHVPFFYNLALLNDAIHLVEHAGFAFAAMYLWRNVIDPHPMRSRVPMVARLLFLAVVEAANIILSAFLTFSDSVWYAYEGIPLPRWWTWGHLQDQQLGGLIMWVPGGVINVLAMSIVFAVWVKREREADQRRLASEEAARVETLGTPLAVPVV